MNDPRNLRQALPRLLAISIATVSVPFLQAAEGEPDPWFQERVEREAKAEDGEEKSSAILRKQSPRALYKALMKDFAAAPEHAISQRIDILEEAARVAPGEADEARRLLAELKLEKSQAIAALEEAGEQARLAQGFALVKPYSRHFAGDADLRSRLNASKLVRRLDAETRALGSDSQLDELRALDAAIAQSGFAAILGERAKGAFQGGLAEIIEAKWQAAFQGAAPLPGEQFLMSRLLGADDAKLALALRFSDSIAPDTADQIDQNIRRLWTKQFDVALADRAAQPDLVLNIATDDVQVSRSEDAAQVKSQVPGRISEEPNPDFMAAVAKYKKSAESYEKAMKSYEAQYKNYIDNLSSGASDHAKQNQQAARANYNSAFQAAQARGVEIVGADPNVSAAQDNMAIADALANSLGAPMIPEPVKPYPSHLRMLDTIYSMPSTIVVAEDSTEYEYTAKKLDYRFALSAELELAAPDLASAAAATQVDLSRERSWTQNVGADPRDPAVGKGDFSEAELESARDLFNLEFASACAKKLEELLSVAAARFEQSAARDSKPEALVLSLSLRARSLGEQAASFSEADLRALAELAQRGDLTPEEFRRECLLKAAAHSPIAPKLSAEQIRSLL